MTEETKKYYWLATEPNSEQIVGVVDDIVISTDIITTNSWIIPGKQYNSPGITRIKPVEGIFYKNDTEKFCKIFGILGNKRILYACHELGQQWYKLENCFISQIDIPNLDNKINFTLQIGNISPTSPTNKIEQQLSEIIEKESADKRTKVGEVIAEELKEKVDRGKLFNFTATEEKPKQSSNSEAVVKIAQKEKDIEWRNSWYDRYDKE